MEASRTLAESAKIAKSEFLATMSHEIRKLPGEVARIPIVAMTANAMKGDRERCIQAGMNDYVSKPVDPVNLLQRIAFWMGGEQDAVPGEGPGKAGRDVDTELGDDAAAALADLLGSIDDVVGEPGSQAQGKP